MIALVELRALDLERAALEVRSGHLDDRRGRRAWRRRRLSRGARHGAACASTSGADRLRCSNGSARSTGIRVHGPPSADAPRRPHLLHARRASIHTTSPSCSGARASACAPSHHCAQPLMRCLGVGRDRPRELRRLQRAGRRRRPRRGASRAAQRSSRADGRPLPRLHPRALQAPAQLRRARAARPRGARAQPAVRRRARRADRGRATGASPTCASTDTAARSPRRPRRSPPRSSSAWRSRRSRSSTPTGCSSCSGSRSRRRGASARCCPEGRAPRDDRRRQLAGVSPADTIPIRDSSR